MPRTARRLIAIAALALATFTATHAAGAHATVQAGGGYVGGGPLSAISAQG